MRTLSQRARARLWILQTATLRTAEERRAAIRILFASQHAATSSAQSEYWLEFAVLHEEYRAAVRQLVEFCKNHPI